MTRKMPETMKPAFTIVDDDVAKRIKDEIERVGIGRGHIGERARALMDGHMIFVPGETGLGGLYNTLRKRGYKVRSRRDDGGTYVWADKMEETDG